MRQALIANYNYCLKLAEAIHGQSWDITEYKLVRKEVYLSSANLGGAFQRMLSEPKRKQGNAKNIGKFTVLNHLLSSYIANLSSVLQQEQHHEMNSLHIKWVRKCLFNLQASIEALETQGDEPFKAAYPEIPAYFEPVKPEDWNEHLLNEQLQLCYKLTKDLRKLAEGIR